MSKQSTLERAAILGGQPVFKEEVAITKPTLPSINVLEHKFGSVLKSGMITNARYVKELENKAAQYLDVKHAVALSSCTGGLMLLMKTLGLKGEVILPSFTFHATAHAVVWSGLKPVFVDCDPETFNIDPQKIEQAVTHRTSAVLAVHIFGSPSPIRELVSITRKFHLSLLFDSAHGFGAMYKGRKIGCFGKAEVFSLSPTKLLTAGEGGLVATNDDAIAELIRTGRNYGDPGNYDSEFSGFNARMSEFDALLGIASLKDLENNVIRRNRLAKLYKKLLGTVPGIIFQRIDSEDRSTVKDFSILIDKNRFGLDRDVLCTALAKENINARKYFYPPVHAQKAFKMYHRRKYAMTLRVTNSVAENILSLPLYSHMTAAVVRNICYAVRRIQKSHKAILRGASV